MDEPTEQFSTSPSKRTRKPTTSLMTNLQGIKRRRNAYAVYQEIVVDGSSDDLFMDGNSPTADVTISCGDMSWGAHKLVLTARCPFFKAYLNWGCQEAVSSTIKLDDESSHVCGIFLEFLYTLNLLRQRSFWNRRGSDGRELRIDIDDLVDLCGMAHKYGVPRLFLSIADLLDRDLRFKDYNENGFDALIHLFMRTREYDDCEEMLFLQRKLIEFMNRKNTKQIPLSDENKAILAQNPDLVCCLYLKMTPVEISRLAYSNK